MTKYLTAFPCLSAIFTPYQLPWRHRISLFTLAFAWQSRCGCCHWVLSEAETLKPNVDMVGPPQCGTLKGLLSHGKAMGIKKGENDHFCECHREAGCLPHQRGTANTLQLLSSRCRNSVFLFENEIWYSILDWLIACLIDWVRVLLGNPGWSGIHHPPVSVFWVLRL